MTDQQPEELPRPASPIRSSSWPAADASVLRRRGRKRLRTRRPADLTEWHAMNEDERAAGWAQLCDWVAWLHDRYELSVEERLPPCWPHHPGLIEELRALKAWREEIYTSGQPSGQAARYWHAEMRQTITAATTFYASGCRAGHRGAPYLVAGGAPPELVRAWAQADHVAGIPPVMLKHAAVRRGEQDGDLFLTEDTMRAHQASELAIPLSRTIADYLRYDSSWWQRVSGGGWLRVTDPAYAATLDHHAEKLTAADAHVAKSASRCRPFNRLRNS
jgi:hypothetical protein